MSEMDISSWMIRSSFRLHLPLTVHFDLTYRCNERCVHCYLDHSNDEDELSAIEIRDIMLQLRRAGTLFLAFSGGEMFLRKDLLEILREAKQIGFDVTLKSNGTLIEPNVAKELKSLGIRLVQISLYSYRPEKHDQITGVAGSFDRSLAAIRLLRQQGIPVRLACPLMTLNIADLHGMLALASDLGTSCLIDFTIAPGMNGDLRPLALRATAEALTPALAEPRLSYANGETPRCPSGSEQSNPGDEYPCRAGHNMCYISPGGDVYPCAQLPIPLGNLRRQRFEEIWKSPELAHILAVRVNDVTACAECDLRGHCQRCPGLALVEDDGFDGPSRRACELAEARARLSGHSHPRSAYSKLESIEVRTAL